MQQFATTQTTIAANKPQFEDTSLSSVALRDSNKASFGSSEENKSQKSAFENALAQHERSSSRRSQDSRDETEKSLQANSISERNAKQTAKVSEQKNTILEERAEKKSQAVAADRQQGSDTISNAEDTTQRTKNMQLRADSAPTETEQTLDNLSDDFDWVAYVNQVKDLSASSDIVPNDLYIEDKTTSIDIFTQTIASLNNASLNNASTDNDASTDSKADSAENNINTINADIVDAETDPEFLEISLTEKELTALINAAGGDAEKLSLNSDDMAELDKAIAKLLNQLMSKEDSGIANSPEELKDTVTEVNLNKAAAKSDADLLKDLLQASTNRHDIKDEQKVLLATDKAINSAELKADKSNLVNEVKQSDVSKANRAKPVGEVLLSKTSEAKPIESSKQTEELLTDVEEMAAASNAQLTKTNKSLAENPDKLAVSPLLVSVDKLSTKKHTALLANLPPEAESRAIENIAQRVESVISELKMEGKSTEFIAALQSGIKEIKEQLKQGREPGIDLKSLVSDALAQSDVKVSGNTEVALEKQLNQLSTILAAATSVNQSNQQQNFLNTGLTEVQGMKELSQQQIESTRLAQQTGASEKAVNIFKPEGQQQLTEKVRWMVNSRNLSAEIRLDPADLGGMNIKVNLSGDSASVSFVVQSQHARDALDQALPKLREMLDEQGIELGQSSVEQESQGSNEQPADSSFANNSDASSNLAQQSQEQGKEDNITGSTVIEQAISGGRIGGIDYYA